MGNKYHNPISKPKTVTIPTWEYASLISKANTLEILQWLIQDDKKYMAADMLEALFAHPLKIPEEH